MTEHELLFAPPLTLENALPYPVDIRVAERGSDSMLEVRLSTGELKGVCSFAMQRDLLMSTIDVEMLTAAGSVGSFRSKRAVLLYRVPRRLLARQAPAAASGSSVLSELVGRRLPRTVKMMRRPVQGTAAADAAAGPDGRAAINRMASFELSLLNVAHVSSRARRVTIYCPFWLVNESGVTLSARQGTGSSPVNCPSSLLGEPATPVLYSPSRGAEISLGLTTAALGQTSRRKNAFYWSNPVPLTSVGLAGAASILVTADRLPTVPSGEAEDGEAAEGGFPPFKRGYASGCVPAILGGASSRQLRVELGISLSIAPSVFLHTKVPELAL